LSKNEEFAKLVERYKASPEFYCVKFVDANQTGMTGDTLLHAAVIRGASDDIDILMRMGARVNAIGDLGNTPLHHAASRGLSEIVHQLLRYRADPNIKYEFGQTPLDLAVIMKRGKVAAILRASKTPR
jgi:uncharacterized protein